MLAYEQFLKIARYLPRTEAFSFNGVSLTYAACVAQMKSLAQGLAIYLPQGARVAINTCKPVDAFLLMLACLYKGFTCVPIDTYSPIKQRRFILQDSNASALLVDTQTAADWQLERDALASLQLIIGSPFSLQASAHHLTLQELASSGAGKVRSKVAYRLSNENELAYILYNVGATGDPRGVMITHSNIAACIDWASVYFDVHVGDRVAVQCLPHLEIPIVGIYISLARGATLCPITEQTLSLPQAMLRFLQDERITVLYVSSAILMLLFNPDPLPEMCLPSLRFLLCAGGQMHPMSLARALQTLPHTRIFYLYGSMEINVAAALEIFPTHLRHQRIPLGRPLSNTRIFLRDAVGQIVDVSHKEGEILVCGPGVSPGYLNRPDLVAQSWVDLIFRDRHWRCYLTHDFACWDEQGILYVPSAVLH
jgi:non-ribosomal peptide synthetase component F